MPRLLAFGVATYCLLLAIACGGESRASETFASLEAHPGDVAVEVPIQEAVPVPEPAVVVVEPAPLPPKERKVVVLDPGHGGDEIGASRNGVAEKASNLDMALRVERLLLAEGLDVVLTRRTDERAAGQIPGYTATRSDLQARLDLANAARGDVFVSIHSNGSESTAQNGVEAWYDSTRSSFAAEGQALAGLLLENVLSELRGIGYVATNRGLFDGACFRMREGRCFTLFVIAGPRRTSREEVMRRGGDPEALGFGNEEHIFSRPANMPAALIELLIITNPADAAVLRDEGGRNAMAKGVAKAILTFLAHNQPGS
jgi:N-acetylmuramoyl-L-alanine amidase